MKLRFVSIFALAATLVAIVPTTPASADSVDYSIVFDDVAGTFDLFAELDGIGNFGLLQYAVEIIGADTITHVSPNATFAQAAVGAVGFNIVRSKDNAKVTSAAQDVINSRFTPVLGFGINAGDLAADFGPLFGASVQPQYGVPLLLATGTFTQEAVLSIIQFDGLVFTAADGSTFARPEDGFTTSVSGGPDPMPPTVASDSAIIAIINLADNPNLLFAFQAADPDGDIANGSFSTTLVKSGPGDTSGASIDADGNFSWDATGVALGDYTFEATFTDDQQLAGTGVLSVTVTDIPEPATMALYGLALVGLGFIRRK